jgi:signal peptide peptidase SppA
VSNSRYSSIVRAIYSTPWAIMPDKLEAICAFIQLKLSGGLSAPETIAAIRAQNEVSAARAQNVAAAGAGSIAILPLYGIINQRYSGDFSGPSGTSIQQFTQQFRQAVNDPSVKAIVIDVDSPGGSVHGVDELAAEIFQARSKKKIIAVSNCCMASAAYYIGCQATELVVSPSSITGSIGVYMAHADNSGMLDQMGVKVTLISAGKYKVGGNNLGPLDDGARATYQKFVEDFYGQFLKAVARGRGVKSSAVANGFGEGRVLTASDAVKAGMADRIATLDDVLAQYGVKQPGGGVSMRDKSTRLAAASDTRIPTMFSVDPALIGASSISGPKAEDGDCTCPCDSCQQGDCSDCDCSGCESTNCSASDCKCANNAEDNLDGSAKAKASIDAKARSRRLRLART